LRAAPVSVNRIPLGVALVAPSGPSVSRVGGWPITWVGFAECSA
jgi:hypothetical protein